MRQITPEMPTPSRRGLPPLLFPALIWCVFLGGLLVTAGAGLDKVYRELSTAAPAESLELSLLEQAENNVRSHPRLELRNIDKRQQVITYRDRDANKVYIISFVDAAAGRFPGRNDDATIELLAQTALEKAEAESIMTVSEPAEPVAGSLLNLDTEPLVSMGESVGSPLGLQEEVDLLPAVRYLPEWIPAEENWLLTQMPDHTQNAARETWRATVEAEGAMTELADRCVQRLEAAGFTVTRRMQDAGRMSAEIVRAEHAGEKKTVGLAFTRERREGPTRIAITAESAK